MNIINWENLINKVNYMDAVELLSVIPDESIDLVLTDPPYGINYQSNMRIMTEILKKILTQFSQENSIVLDTFMGSWSMARACVDLKRNFIGCELDESYCEIGRQKLRQQTLF